MGVPKALLTFEGETFLARLVRVFTAGGCDPVVVVLGPGEERDAIRLLEEAGKQGARVVINPERHSQQIDSLRIALRYVPAEVSGILVTPVDAPGATVEVIRAMKLRAREGASIVVPTYEGRRGHPVFFGRTVFPDLASGSLEEGARTLMTRYRADLAEVTVSESRILLDIDTPADFDRLKKGTG